MKLKSALKRKGHLIKECDFFQKKLNEYNSVPKEDAKTRSYDPRESLSNWLQKVDELIELKYQIQRANIPIFKKIVRMAELKGVVKSLAALDCYAGSGRNNGEYYRRDSTYESVISVKERDQLIKKLEKEIATIQDEVDDFNLTTQIVL